MTHRQTKPWLLWLLWTLAGAGLLFFVVLDEGTKMHPLTWLALMLGMAPLIGAQLALGSPNAAAAVQTWLDDHPRAWLVAVGVLSGFYLLTGLLTLHFDPYATVIFIVGLLAAFGTLREIQHGRRGLTWADIAVWLLLWIPFDLRWNYDLWFGPKGFAYNWWAVLLTVVAVIGWYGLRGLPNFGYRLTPRWKDLGIALVATAVFAVIVIPLGLAIDFLSFPPSHTPTLLGIAAHFVGLFLTVALPEEIFFRGILLHGLDQMSTRRGWTLFLSSVAFGLMHWNNAAALGTKVAYVALATLAGAFYGWAYRKSENNLLAAVLSHTFVDLLWSVLFS